MSRDTKKYLLACLVFALVGFAIYGNTLGSPFFFDDTPSIEDNPFIEQLWPLTRSFGAPPGAGSSGRPLVSFSLALNYALGGREVLGYHIFNIGVLVLGACALFALGRRALLRSSMSEFATGLAFSIALLWMVHPLHTDTLNQVVYRNGAMMALFYFTSLYCALRIFEGAKGHRWVVGCVLSSAAAMACKEIAVSLPLAILLMERQLGSGTLCSAIRKRAPLYLGLAGTWGLLAICVSTGDRGDSVGFGHTEIIDGIDYLRTQTVAIVKYLKLSVLVGPFLFDYEGFGVMRSWSNVWLETGLLAVAFGASIFGFMRRSIVGLLGLGVFAALAPTSSFIPLAGELAAEHRMYLPLAPLMALVVVFVGKRLVPACRCCPWVLPVCVLALASFFSFETVRRNGDYASRVTLWQDTVEKAPENVRAWNHLALALKNEGRADESEVAFLRTLALDPDHGKASYNYGNLLFARGDRLGALERFAHAATCNPTDTYIRFNYGVMLNQFERAGDALVEFRAALVTQPEFDRALMLLAWPLATSKDGALRNGAEALVLAQRLNRLSGHRLPRHLDILAAALAETGDFQRALQVTEQALQLARASNVPRLVQRLDEHRNSYLAGQPVRE